MNVAHKPIPGFSNGYAYNAGISAFPNLWRRLVGAWCPFMGKQGAKVYDFGPYKMHGTMTNNAPSTDNVPSAIGNAINYDGTNDTILCGSRNEFSFTDGSGNDTPGSVSTWVKLTSFVGTNMIFSKYNLDGASEYNCFYDGSLVYMRFLNTTDSLWIGRTAPFASATYLNQWAHIVITYTGSETNAGVSIYINGIRLDSANTSSGAYVGMTRGASEFQIGARRHGTSEFPWVGQIGQVYIYNRALTPSEILQLYLNPFAPFELREMVYGKAPAVAGGVTYPQLERGIRGLERGIYAGAL